MRPDRGSLAPRWHHLSEAGRLRVAAASDRNSGGYCGTAEARFTFAGSSVHHSGYTRNESTRRMVMAAGVWTVDGFLDHLAHLHRAMANRAISFILGAGASAPSGIPTGGALVDRWLIELHRREDPEYRSGDIAVWATANNVGIPGFEYQRRSEFYSNVFVRRFR